MVFKNLRYKKVKKKYLAFLKSQEVLSETKAYESPQFKRMKDLMSKLK